MKHSFLLLLAGMLLAGCGKEAVQADAYRMVPTWAVYENTGKTIGVKPFFNSSGRFSNAARGAAADPEIVQYAVSESLRFSNLFTVLPGSAEPDYFLYGDILLQSIPDGGVDLTVTLMIRFTVIDNGTSEPVLDKNYVETYTAPISGAPLFMGRLKQAIEGAVRLIINDLLQDLDAAARR